MLPANEHSYLGSRRATLQNIRGCVVLSLHRVSNEPATAGQALEENNKEGRKATALGL